MVNRRGQFFSLYLVLLTLLMCGIVIGFYILQQKNISARISSPRPILELRDELEIFEIREREIIEKSLENAMNFFDFGVEEEREKFLEEFRKGLLNGLRNDAGIVDFIFKDLVVNGRVIYKDAINVDDFFENVLYPTNSFRYENDKIHFSRGKVSKSFLLDSHKNSKGEEVSFRVEVNFEFEEEYLITYLNKKFILEEL